MMIAASSPWRVVLDHVAQVLGARQAARRMLKVERAAVAVGIRRMMHARRKRPLVIAVAAAQHADHALALAMESTPEADELELLGHRLGKPERRLDRLGATGKQLQMRQSLRQQRGDKIEEARPRFGCEAAEGRPFELLPDALHIVGMAVSDAANGDAGDEVEILVAVHVGDGAAFRVVDDDLREERDRLQPWRHSLGLVVEDRLGFGTRHRAPLERRGRGRDFVHGINSLLRRPGAGAAGSARSGNLRSPARRDRGIAHSSATH